MPKSRKKKPPRKTDRRRYVIPIIIGVVAAIMLGPSLYHLQAPFFYSTDMQYVKAKVLYVLSGKLFNDPVTGYPTFHPPMYHIVLAPFKAIGLSFSTILFWVFVFNMTMTFLMVYKVVVRAFDSYVAMLTCFMMPFIMSYIGEGALLLADSYSFSIAFYLIGLWLFMHPAQTHKFAVLSGLVWGFAFLLSPGHVFLLGFGFLYQLAIARQYKRFLASAVTFLVSIIPFYIQTYVIYSQNLQGTSAFAFWRGFPGGTWLTDLVVTLFGGNERNLLSVGALITVATVITALTGMFKTRKVPWFAVVAGVAFLFTFYHFSHQYAVRVQFILMIFAGALAMNYVSKLRVPRLLTWGIIAVICALSFHRYYSSYSTWQSSQHVAHRLMSQENYFPGCLDGYISPGDFIFCSKYTYLYFLMPRTTAHALGCYKTMEYFQLKTEISQELEADYNTIVNSNDYSQVMQIADKYGIRVAVFRHIRRDLSLPLHKVLTEHWEKVHDDGRFQIFSRDLASRSGSEGGG
ncbi:MAG: hypothetical protein ABII79_06400 [bacterium]